MVIVPPRHFIVIENPVIRNPNPKDVLDVVRFQLSHLLAFAGFN